MVVLGVRQPRVPGSVLPKNEGLEWRKGWGCLTAFYSDFQPIFLFRAHLHLQASASSRALGASEPSNPSAGFRFHAPRCADPCAHSPTFRSPAAPASSLVSAASFFCGFQKEQRCATRHLHLGVPCAQSLPCSSWPQPGFFQGPWGVLLGSSAQLRTKLRCGDTGSIQRVAHRRRNVLSTLKKTAWRALAQDVLFFIFPS